MRCENCPALQNVGGYEYPEYQCVVQDEDKILTFRDGHEGCCLACRTIEKRIEEYEDARAHEYDGIAEWYILTHEIEGVPEFRNKCVSLMEHAVGLDNTAHVPYKRHGKLFYRAWRNYFATTRATQDYKYWEKLHSCKLADCSSTDDTPFWEPQEMLYYRLTKEGMEWLSQQTGITIRPGK